MPINLHIGIREISNGFVVGDDMAGNYVGLAVNERLPEQRYYASLDELANDAGRFIVAAVEKARENQRIQEERLREEEERFRGERAAIESGARQSVGRLRL